MAGRPWDDDPDVDAGGEDAEIHPLLGGSGASLGVGAPESLWDKARNAISQAIGGDPDRAAAKAAGIGLNPTGGELLQGAGMIAAPIAAPGALAAAGRGVASLGGAANIASRTMSGAQGAKRGYRTAGPVGAVAGGVIGAMNPVSTGAIEGAISGAESGGLPGAVGGAVLGTVTGGGASKIAKIGALAKTAETVSGLSRAEKAAEAVSKVKNVVEPITNAEDLIAKINTLREVQKLSGAQIAAALKQWHGIPMKEATQAVKMVLGGS